MIHSFKISFVLFLLILLQKCLYAQPYWKNITNPSVEQLASWFKEPAPEFGPTVTWGWQGSMDREVIDDDLDSLQSKGFRMVTIEAGRMTQPYLSTGYFELIKYAVEAAKKRDMRVWIIDESKYPTGFAGGLFTKDRPDLRMQVLIPSGHFNVSAGKTLIQKVTSNVISAIAYNDTSGSSVIIRVEKGTIKWSAPKDRGQWKIITACHVFRTSPTRASNNPTGAKDTSNSLCDYLNPEAARQFIQFIHEQYKKYIGNEFGKTVIGFRSDEPAYSYTPWTSGILTEFRKQKGYDIGPYLASFFIPNPSGKEKQAKADYWEVFSSLFRDNFFKVIAGWCRKNKLAYEDHLDHDGPEDSKTMFEFVRSEGDYFKDMRYLDIPGIDVIWHQLWPGLSNNFPKLASSAAHLFGRPQVFSESFAAFQPAPDIQTVKWILNEQFVRGINQFEIMFYPASTGREKGFHGFMASDSFPTVMRAASRKACILSNGKPAAKIGLYFPTPALWLGDTVANNSTWHIAKELLEHQRDFDFVDDQSLACLMRLKNGVFRNASGQAYGTIIIPSVNILSAIVLRRLKTFQAEGGKVIFMGERNLRVEDGTFTGAKSSADISWVVKESTDKVSPEFFRALPDPDVQFDSPCSDIKYIHRHLRDGEVYFFFNESNQRKARTTTVQGTGIVQVWDPRDGSITPLGGTYIEKDYAKIPLDLAPFESRIIVLGKLPEKHMQVYFQTSVHPRFTFYLPDHNKVNHLPAGPLKPGWQSLSKNYQLPQWFINTKFGIFIHWGLYAVPARHNEWYALYQKGDIANWHKTHYGAQDSFGYKDVIPLFSANKFDPQKWAELFKNAGAKYVVPFADHHDGFAMYGSDLTVRDAMDMGPHRDLIGEMATDIPKEGLLFGMSDHEIETWSFMYPHLDQPADIFNARFLNQWLAVSEEMVDKYQPQLFYFDNGVDLPRLDSMKQQFGAYYYNRARQWNKGVTICSKFDAYPDTAGVHEYEKQVRSPRTIQSDFWQTDDVISNFSWEYVSDMRYRTTASILPELIENVTKNGALILNISPRAYGSIPKEQQDILLSLGEWLETNGEAIYGTRPWYKFGEGPSSDTTINLCRYQYTGKDFRITTNGDTLCAMAMRWPGNEALITSL